MRVGVAVVIALFETGEVDEGEAIRRLKAAVPFPMTLVFGADEEAVSDLKRSAKWSAGRRK